jgi:hypothetical protein
VLKSGATIVCIKVLLFVSSISFSLSTYRRHFEISAVLFVTYQFPISQNIAPFSLDLDARVVKSFKIEVETTFAVSWCSNPLVEFCVLIVGK